MSREVHAGFCERREVRLLPATHLTLSGSGRLLRNANRLRSKVTEIARQEGFAVNDRKSTLTTRAGRQRVCGVVVNQRTNIARADYDTLKATIHNAVRHGPDGQNRTGVPDFRAHLLGRIAWVEQLHPEQAAKLRHQFEQIVWSQDA